MSEGIATPVIIKKPVRKYPMPLKFLQEELKNE
jgi:hypothetical protein